MAKKVEVEIKKVETPKIEEPTVKVENIIKDDELIVKE